MIFGNYLVGMGSSVLFVAARRAKLDLTLATPGSEVNCSWCIRS